MSLVITGFGLVSALGSDPGQVARSLAAGESGLSHHPPLEPLGDARAGVVEGPELRPWLVRRKDRKLLARSAELALAAAGPALGDWPGDRVRLGLFLGVGREPPDDGESEGALIASQRDGVLDPELLAGPGRDRYPPLLPLKTLPNMALAHVSINLGAGGANGAWAGGADAGLMALRAAWWSVSEGQCDAALAGAADSQVDLGSARDRLRSGAPGAPGEGAAMVLIEHRDRAMARGARILAELSVLTSDAEPTDLSQQQAALGDCGAADGALAVLLAAHGSGRTRVWLAGPAGGGVGLDVVAAC